VEDWPEDLRKAVESETVKAQVEKHAKG
jgi:hypothetical protein